MNLCKDCRYYMGAFNSEDAKCASPKGGMSLVTGHAVISCRAMRATTGKCRNEALLFEPVETADITGI